MKDKTKIYIDLSKCSEEQQNYIFSLLPESLSSLQYEIDEYNFILDYEDDEWWVNGTKPPVFKQELTYPEFIKLFEGEEGEKKSRIEIMTDEELQEELRISQYHIEALEHTVRSIENEMFYRANPNLLNSNQ